MGRRRIITEDFALKVQAHHARTGASTTEQAELFGCSRGTIYNAKRWRPPAVRPDEDLEPAVDVSLTPDEQPEQSPPESPGGGDIRQPDLRRIIISHLGMANQQAKQAFRENNMSRLATAQKLAISCIQLLARLTPDETEDKGVFVTTEKLTAWGNAARAKLEDYARRGEKLPGRCPQCGYVSERVRFFWEPTVDDSSSQPYRTGPEGEQCNEGDHDTPAVGLGDS